MFENIGNKIKSVASVLSFLGIMTSIIAGVGLMLAEETAGLGITILILGVLISWIGGFSLYGYGELIDQTTEISKMLKNAFPCCDSNQKE